MPREISVTQRTQRIYLNPSSGSVTVVNSGPPGPAGPEGVFPSDAMIALSTATKVYGPITTAEYELLTPSADTLYLFTD